MFKKQKNFKCRSTNVLKSKKMFFLPFYINGQYTGKFFRNFTEKKVMSKIFFTQNFNISLRYYFNSQDHELVTEWSN